MIDKYILETILRKRSHKPTSKPIKKKEAKKLRATNFAFAKLEEQLFYVEQ